MLDFSSVVLRLRISRLKAELKNARDNFELYKEILDKIKHCEDLARRAKEGEDVLL
jgi:DNA primase